MNRGSVGLSPALIAVVTGLVAAHVVDDAFLQPEPGTTAADHLGGGSVSLAALLLMAVVAIRVRSGWGAVAALIIGLAGVVGGIEGAYAVRYGSPARDDFSGVAALVAGAVLVVVTCVQLWRGRRRDGPRIRRYLRRGLTAVIAVILLLQVGYPLASAYVGTHVALPAPSAAGLDYEDVEIVTGDGVVLRGWYLPSGNRAAVITYPGRGRAQPYAEFLARHGYGVLLLDRRGQGGSTGDPNSYGWDGARDITAAVNFLKSRPDVDADRIGGMGFSVGGEVLLETAARTPELQAVVAEGAGFRSIREFRHIAATSWFSYPLAWFATLGTAVFAGRMPPPDLTALVGRIGPRPVLLIQAEVGVGGEQLNPLYASAIGPTAELWRVPGSSHVGGLDAQPEEYQRRVINFFDRALLAPGQ